MLLVSFGLGALSAVLLLLLVKKWRSRRRNESMFAQIVEQDNWFY